ncbi:MAG TPA: DUF4959 domain-containing protein [Bacteroidales bacterium]|nr:DUF4959 domain-containing protein [Bacteroidales bacterium]
MNKILYTLTSIVFCACMFLSCEKEDDDTSAPAPVADVTVKAGYGELMFEWTPPQDSDLHYVNISFKDVNGNPRSEKVSHFVKGDTITGFADTTEYSFTLTAIDRSGNASEPITVTAKPLAPPFSKVIKTVQLVPDFGGAKVSWENVTGATVSVQVMYKDNDGKKVANLFTSAAAAGEGLISNLNANERVFSVTVTDIAGNVSDPVSFTVLPLAESLVDKSQWAVVSFSSEEPAENPNGFAKNIFDGKLNTFWHSAWSSSQPGYPHWIIVDMQKEITISRFECFRRQGNGNGQTSHQFLTSTDGATWVDQGTFAFDAGKDAGQSFRMVKNPKARYFKYVALEGPNFYAFLGEINVYGAAE